MKQPSKNSLHRCLLTAILSYDETNPEEQGGFILKKNDEPVWEFVPVKNSQAGTTQARGLYVADQIEFNNKVALRTIDDDYEVYASFHTHPQGMRALPSTIDIRYLFKNFSRHYIYAYGKELNEFLFFNNRWDVSNVMTFDGFDGPWPWNLAADLTNPLFEKLVKSVVWEPVEC